MGCPSDLWLDAKPLSTGDHEFASASAYLGPVTSAVSPLHVGVSTWIVSELPNTRDFSDFVQREQLFYALQSGRLLQTPVELFPSS